MATQQMSRRRSRFNLSTQRGQDILTAYLCLAPWLIGILCFTLGPMIFSFGLSFFNSDLLITNYWVGISNYQELFNDPLFWHSIRVTALYAFTSVPLSVVTAMGIALLLNQKIPGLGVWRTIYYLPTVISGVAISILWLQIFNPRAGMINNFLSIFSIQGPKWLFDSHWAMPALMLMSLWSVGANVLLYLAGMQGIPTTFYEAATIDGAN